MSATSPPTTVAARSGSGGRLGRRPLTGGGTEGNEQLTAMSGVILLAMFAVLGVTILRIGQLMWAHLFVGFLLVGPVALKMASTGYRFVRYYTGDPVYRHKGPPELGLRAVAPVIVVSTVVVFASGIVLLFNGPRDRAQMLLIHKASFIVWLVVMALHVLGHLPRLRRSLRVGRENAEDAGISSGAAGRWMSIAGAVVGGLVVAIVLIPHFGVWTGPGVLVHHHHG